MQDTTMTDLLGIDDIQEELEEITKLQGEFAFWENLLPAEQPPAGLSRQARRAFIRNSKKNRKSSLADYIPKDISDKVKLA